MEPGLGWGGVGGVCTTQLNLLTRRSTYIQDFQFTYKTFNLPTRLSTYLQDISPTANYTFNKLTTLSTDLLDIKPKSETNALNITGSTSGNAITYHKDTFIFKNVAFQNDFPPKAVCRLVFVLVEAHLTIRQVSTQLIICRIIDHSIICDNYKFNGPADNYPCNRLTGWNPLNIEISITI